MGLFLSAYATSACGDSAPRPLKSGSLRETIEVAIAEASREARQSPLAPEKRAACTDKSFNLIHVNDMQARYSDRLGGRTRYGYIAGYFRAAKEADPATIVLDAGDDHEKGSVVDLRSQGEATRAVLRHMSIDVRTIGNHDFAYGAAAVRREVKNSTHPLLSANISDELRTFRPSVKLTIGCARVGVIGLTTKGYGSDDQPTTDPYDDTFKQDTNYATYLQAEVDKMRDEVDVVIALTHLGLVDDTVLVSNVTGVDIVVGGHSENRLDQPTAATTKSGERAWIVQAGHYGELIGKGRLQVQGSGRERRVSFARYELVNVNDKMPFAEDVGYLVERLETTFAPGFLDPIGNAPEAFPQSNLPRLAYDAVKAEWKGDALIIGRDAFWKGIPKGPVTLQQVYDTVLVQKEPSGTSGFTALAEVELKGSELREVQYSLKDDPQRATFFPSKIEANETYRLFVEKRSAEHWQFAFTRPQKFEAKVKGELIDVLEPYIRNHWNGDGSAPTSVVTGTPGTVPQASASGIVATATIPIPSASASAVASAIEGTVPLPSASANDASRQ